MAQQAGTLVVHEPRAGYGYACAAGVRAAAERDAQVLVFLDADGSFDPAQIPELLAPIEAGVADLVPIPAALLRHVVEQLDRPELESCWTDDMTLGWVYQYWNDPEREALDAKLNFDDNAMFRHKDIMEYRDLDEEERAALKAERQAEAAERRWHVRVAHALADRRHRGAVTFGEFLFVSGPEVHNPAHVDLV